MALTHALRPAAEATRRRRSPRPVKDQVVVVIGASSGIGRETALRLAAKGARVVLAARCQQTLDDPASEIVAAGGECTTIPVDVAEPRQLERLAEQAMDWQGRIDTWINDAAVSEYAPFK
jgi:short-subunit dehydrogenase